MTPFQNGDGQTAPKIAEAVRCWERGRIIYNAALLLVVLLWIALSWPHFRPSLTWSSLVAVLVLGLLANLCYSAAYIAEVGMRTCLPRDTWRRNRQIIFVLGTLFAIVLTNYWIADEIYPHASQPPKLF
jgi:uncharacterized membrane protein